MEKASDYKFWIDKIASSKYFTSANDSKLLHYLASTTLEGKVLKETVIAVDVFGRDASYDPGSDSIVRSNIYNLRKKLESYYLEEGADDSLCISIPKGSYKVNFHKVEKEVARNRMVTKFKQNIMSVFALISALILVGFYLSGQLDTDSKKVKNNPVWSYYSESESPLLIVLGDYFMMENIQLPDSSFRYIRDPKINNQNDFQIYLDDNPELKTNFKTLGQSYFGEEIPKCYSQLINLLGRSNNVSMKYSSELTFEDVRENDLIFIGDFATLGLLKPFFKKTGFRYSNLPPVIYLLNEMKDTTDFITLNNPDKSVFQNDYAVVANICGYEKKKILFLLSFLPFGKSEALYKLTDDSFIYELMDNNSQIPENWHLLMKVSGLQSTGFYYEVLRFSEIY
jgi:hypothetical protein